jgi:hypothetical protein
LIFSQIRSVADLDLVDLLVNNSRVEPSSSISAAAETIQRMEEMALAATEQNIEQGDDTGKNLRSIAFERHQSCHSGFGYA